MHPECKRPLRALAGAAIALTAPIALAGEITLFEHRDFHGDSITLQRGVPNLERTSLDDSAASLVVRGGVWEACTDAYFRGNCAQLQPGEYGRLDGILNDRIASVREVVTTGAAPAPIVVASAEPRIALFEYPGFSGRAVELTETHGKLDQIGSYVGADAVIVYGGTWRLCSRDYYRGECWDFVPGRYENLGALNGRVRSAELVSVTGAPVAAVPTAPALSPSAALLPATGRVVLYEYPNFRGQSFAIDRSDLPNLNRMGFSDRAASMRIDSGYWMFCTDSRFLGNCRTMGPGEYASLPPDVDRKIVSVRRVNDLYGFATSNQQYLR